jgi:hypothetical protein
MDLLSPMDSGYLIPSFVQTYNQIRSCQPNASNNYECSRRYDFVDAQGNKQQGPGRALPVGEAFVADIDTFTLLIDHSFRVESGAVEYGHRKMQGYWLDCSKKKWTVNNTWLPKIESEDECVKRPIICAHDDCKQLGMIEDEKAGETTSLLAKPSTSRLGRFVEKHGKNRRREGVLPHHSSELQVEAAIDGRDTGQLLAKTHDVYAIPPGDVLSLRTLYSMAGRSLDDSWYDADHGVNLTTRQRGTVLVVNIHYTNLKPWTLFRPMDPPEYVISVTSQPVKKFKHMKAYDLPDGKHRQLEVSYGTLVIVRSSGSIGVFRMIHMLIVFSTSLGLLAAASVVTDVLALYVLPLRKEYFKAKYEETEDYHDFREKQQAEKGEAQSSGLPLETRSATHQ